LRLEEEFVNDKIMLDKLRWWFSDQFKMLEKIIEICPDDLWNKKFSGYYFWQYLLHAFIGIHKWLREEKTEFTEPYKNEKLLYSEMESDPQKILSKDDLRKFCAETKNFAEKWFDGKDEDWLKQTNKIYDGWQNWEQIVGQVGHLSYHVGYSDAILREHGVKGVWND
jgi:hypothetical protein